MLSSAKASTMLSSIAGRMASLEVAVQGLTRAVQRLALQPSPPSPPSPPPPSPPPPPPPPRPQPAATPPPPLDSHLVFFDFETTGLGKTRDIRVREVGAIGLGARSAVEGYREAVDPLVPVQPQALAVAPAVDDAEGADTWKEVGPRFHAFVDRHGHQTATPVLCGFNSKRYDTRILAFENLRHNVVCPPYVQFVDFLEVLPHFFPQMRRPWTLDRFHQAAFDGLSIPSAHTALADAQALRDIAKTLPRERLLRVIDEKKETLGGVNKRCGIELY